MDFLWIPRRERRDGLMVPASSLGPRGGLWLWELGSAASQGVWALRSLSSAHPDCPCSFLPSQQTGDPVALAESGLLPVDSPLCAGA